MSVSAKPNPSAGVTCGTFFTPSPNNSSRAEDEIGVVGYVLLIPWEGAAAAC